MRDQVEEVKSKTDIVSLIGDYISLKKAGKNFKATCPFHSEKIPSFNVSPSLQIFKCFGCGESGDVYSFLEKYEGMEFQESLKFLAQKAGVKLKPVNFTQGSAKEEIFKINSLATKFYSYILLNHPVGKRALDYLLSKRGLKLDSVKKFQLGYSPDKPLAMRKFLVEKNKINLNSLERAGLVYMRGKSAVDRFRNRIIFPLHDHRGNICGFSGRLLPWDKRQNTGKYINTPQTIAYSKSKMLYGLNFTRADIKRADFALVVEGELDMISGWQVGVQPTVAIKGSALTQEHIKLLSRYTSNLILGLDTDIAGNEAAKKGIEMAQKEGFEIKVVDLKDYKDPDEMAQKDPKAYKKAVDNAVSIWDFLTNSAFPKKTKLTGEQKAKISKEVIPVLASIDDDIVKAHYVDLVSRKLGVPRISVEKQLQKRHSTLESSAQEKILYQDKSSKNGKEERLMALSLHKNPKLLLKKEIAKMISNPLYKKIIRQLQKYLKTNKKLIPSDFVLKLPQELVKGYSDLVIADVDENNLEDEIKMTIWELKKEHLKEKRTASANRLKELYKKGGDKFAKENERHNKLSQKLIDLEEKGYKGIIL